MERPSAATTRRLPQTSDCHFLGDLGPAFLPGSQRSSPTSDRPIGVEPSTPPWSTRAIQWKAISCFPGTGTGTGTFTGEPEFRDRHQHFTEKLVELRRGIWCVDCRASELALDVGCSAGPASTRPGRGS